MLIFDGAGSAPSPATSSEYPSGMLRVALTLPVPEYSSSQRSLPAGLAVGSAFDAASAVASAAASSVAAGGAGVAGAVAPGVGVPVGVDVGVGVGVGVSVDAGGFVVSSFVFWSKRTVSNDSSPIQAVTSASRPRAIMTGPDPATFTVWAPGCASRALASMTEYGSPSCVVTASSMLDGSSSTVRWAMPNAIITAATKNAAMARTNRT
ncbi:hypothetical protein E4M00_07520 [Leifsonia flava]|uniref:Uncharacterized protein n=1 Tax=Orlajensenia leifsoniae TaxID=2561933 RepID=A0A4Y9R508_9MICO|nr:hypothetical protein E4M00_07520 [Leifsonia flava]